MQISHAYMWRQEISNGYPLLFDSLPYPLKTEFLAELGSCHLGAELTDKQAPALGQQTHEAVPNMLHGFWDLNSDLSS